MVLAALIRSPEAALESVERRACRLGADFRVSCDAIRASAERGLSHPPRIRPQRRLAPQLAHELLPSGETRTTLDAGLQEFVIESLRRHLIAIQTHNAHDAAALVVDNATGEVLAYVGGLGDLASASEVDGVRARRQAGSTLKPFLYAVAFDHGYFTPSSLIDDSPIEIPVAAGGSVYRPRNYDQRFHGPVPARTALASSLNVPAVRVLETVGVERLVTAMTAAGFTGLREPGFYGPSLALGSADVTLWDLVSAYRTLANGGHFTPLRLTPPAGAGSPGITTSISNSEKSAPAFGPQAAFLVADILSDRDSRALTFGLENPLASRFWTAAKTGTSKDMRDNWCVGFSSRYTVGVWVGNSSGAPMWDVTGISGAGPAWAEVMDRLHAHQKSHAPSPPPGVARGHDQHWYIAGTETRDLPTASFNRIAYPTNETIVALDPDIPADRQRVTFESEHHDASLRWRLNGQELGRAGGPLAWAPTAGTYALELTAPNGDVTDRVHFLVRGGPVAADTNP